MFHNSVEQERQEKRKNMSLCSVTSLVGERNGEREVSKAAKSRLCSWGPKVKSSCYRTLNAVFNCYDFDTHYYFVSLLLFLIIVEA